MFIGFCNCGANGLSYQLEDHDLDVGNICKYRSLVFNHKYYNLSGKFYNSWSTQCDPQLYPSLE